MTELGFYQGLIVGWFALSAIVFVVLLRIRAPYGRHNRKGWGPQLDATLGWVLMEAPAPLGMLVLFLIGDRQGNLVAWVFLGIWQLHYLNRTFVYPFRRRSKGQQMPLLVALMAVVFNSCNAYLIGRWIFHLGPVQQASWLADPRFIAGVALFVAGYVINQHADYVLLHLRKPGETGYKIPTGGLYSRLSCPNYFGELLEWLGFALLTWSVGSLAFFAWTTANLLPRALANHRWYLETFDDYPKKRRAVIPYLL